MSTESMKEMVRRVIADVWNTGDLSTFDELYSPDYVYGSPGMEGVRGRKAFGELVAMYRTAFPDLTSTVEQQVAEGDTVVSRGTTRGTHRGTFGGLEPTGRTAVVPWVVITRFEGDRIAEDWEIYDALGLMQQLGAMGATPGAEAPARATNR